MDVYKYVNKTANTITAGDFTILPFDEVVVYNTSIKVLDELDGIFIDKYKNGVPITEPIEFNSANVIITNERGKGLRLDPSDPTFGWHDLLSPTVIYAGAAAHKPTFDTMVGGIRAYRFSVGDESFHEFHLPHDYLPDSDTWIHAHWTYAGEAPTGGSVTWNFEISSARGYGAGVWHDPINLSVTQDAPLVPLTHMIAAVKLSNPGGTGGLLDNANIETDGLIRVRLSLGENTISTGEKPFMTFCDMHYRTTGLPTKNAIPDFWQ